MAASIHDLSRARAQRLARDLLGRQAVIDRVPAAQRAERERELDTAFDETLRAAESVRDPDRLTATIAKACLARAVWRSAQEMGLDPDDAADAYTTALFDLANVIHGETRRARRARR